jgi:hypothetical protein
LNLHGVRGGVGGRSGGVAGSGFPPTLPHSGPLAYVHRGVRSEQPADCDASLLPLLKYQAFFVDPGLYGDQPGETGIGLCAPGPATAKVVLFARYVWHGVFTPFRVNGRPNPPARVESQATQLLPVVWTLSGSYDPTQRVAHISGSLTEGGQPVQPIRNDPYGFQGVLWHGTALGGSFPGIVNATAGPLSLDDSGHFSETVPIAQTTYFRASGGTVLGHFGRAACKPPTIAPKGCVSATRSGFARGSLIIEVTVLEGRDRSSESGPGFSPEKLSRGRITPPCGWCAVNASMTGAGMPGIIGA